MPIRKYPLVTNEIYHVYNRGVEHRPIFLSKLDYQRALDSLAYYQFKNSPLSFSYFLRLPVKERQDFLSKLVTKNSKLIEILCFCLMPNHFHLLLRQTIDNGISKYVGNFTNSYTRYFNIRNKRIGHLLQGQFKAVRIETDEQLIHISRYIHLNPFSSYIVRGLDELEDYQWSSLPEYIDKMERRISNPQTVLSYFKTKEKYKEFVFDRADYQRRLENIKHLALE